MHICMFVAELPPYTGGIGYYVYNLSKKLVERGNEVSIFARGSWNHFCEFENLDGINVYKVRFVPLYPYHVRLHGVFLKKQFKLLENNFDLVHFHSPLLPVIPTKLPTLITEHGTVKAPIDNSDLMGVHSHVTKLFSREFISLDIKLLKQVDLITAVSNSCVEDIKRLYNINKKIKTVYNGVETEFFKPKSNNGTKEMNIVYTGRLYTGKGLLDLIKAANYLCSDYPELRFILVGDGPIKSNLQKKISKFGLEKNFEFPGFALQPELLDYYQKAMIYVLPSYYEGFPTTLLEAMSCGVPSIATDVKGCAEIIKDGENGILVPPKDPKRLSEAIKLLLDNPEMRMKLGKNSRKHIAQNYDWNIITNKFEALYNSLVY